MTIPAFVVGVDGGGTKTVAIAATMRGKVLGRGETGSSNFHNVGPRAASRAIRKSVDQARKRAGLNGRRAEVAVVALAAVDSARDRRIAERFVRQAGIARKSIVVHDSEAALYAATRGREGIIVIAGTGCVAAGINREGKYHRASGWGYIIDDEGSAYDMGRKALTSAFRALDGRAPMTALVSALQRRFRVTRLEDALATIYSERYHVEDIAALAPIVVKIARHDMVSRRILENAGVALAESICVVAERLRMKNDRFPVVLVGGAFRAGELLIRPLSRRIRQECPRAYVERFKSDPVRGALMLALKAGKQSHPSSARRSEN